MKLESSDLHHDLIDTDFKCEAYDIECENCGVIKTKVENTGFWVMTRCEHCGGKTVRIPIVSSRVRAKNSEKPGEDSSKKIENSKFVYEPSKLPGKFGLNGIWDGHPRKFDMLFALFATGLKISKYPYNDTGCTLIQKEGDTWESIMLPYYLQDFRYLQDVLEQYRDKIRSMTFTPHKKDEWSARFIFLNNFDYTGIAESLNLAIMVALLKYNSVSDKDIKEAYLGQTRKGKIDGA